MDVDRNEKIWAPSNTGIRTHAFVQMAEGSENRKRALCRKTITRNADSRFIGAKETSLICQSCMMIAVKMWERAEASMEPAQERHDVGYVAPVEDEQAVTEDIRSEAIELDELETLRAELVGKVFRPCVENMHRKLTDRITVTEILTDIGSGLGVAYDIETDDWQGRRVTMHSALRKDLFRQLYAPVSETRWEYSGMVSVLDDYNHETLRRISGYVTAPDWDDARSEVLRLPSLESPRAFLTDLRITQS